MDAKNVTIADVAKLACVSLDTVSRVINGRGGEIKISEKTKEKVLHAAATLGYRPNPFASALRGKKTGIIGAVIRDIEEPFLRKMIRDIQDECHKRGLEVLIGHAAYKMETAERQMNMMMQHLFDGVLIIGNLPGDEKLLQEFSKRGTPIVSVTGSSSGAIIPIGYDNHCGTMLAMKYLHSLGHRRIAFLGNVRHAGVQMRLSAYRDFTRQHALPDSAGFIHESVHGRGAAIVTAKSLMRLPTPPTAIFCTSDLLALGAMSGVWQLGYQVPRDVSIMGYDDIDEASEAYPALTTIRQPTDAAARKALALLVDQMAEPESAQNEELEMSIKPELIVRASCGTVNSIEGTSF